VVWAFYTQEAKIPCPVYRSVVLAHCCFPDLSFRDKPKVE